MRGKLDYNQFSYVQGKYFEREHGAEDKYIVKANCSVYPSLSDRLICMVDMCYN